MDNIETSHHKRMVVAEKVGFRFEADLFKSVQTHDKNLVAAETVGFACEADFFKSV